MKVKTRAAMVEGCDYYGVQMSSQVQLSKAASSKLKSKIEGAVAIAYLITLGLLLKSSSWIFGAAIDEKFGDKSGAFGAYVVVHLVFLLTAIIVIACSYWVIALVYGKDMAQGVVFRWRKKRGD